MSRPFSLPLPNRRGGLVFALLAVIALLHASASAQLDAPRPSEGIRSKPVTTFALTGGRIVVSPERTIEKGTLLFRDGVIVAVGEEVEVPAGTRTIDVTGRTIYAGFIDAYSEVDTGSVAKSRGAPHWNPHVTPQRNATRGFSRDGSVDEKLRGQGIVARLIVPDGGIVKGTSGLVATANLDGARDVLAEEVAQHLRLTISRGGDRKQYPNSPMGAVALARQTFLDADWHRRAHRVADDDATLPRPEPNEALAALEPYLGNRGLVVIETSDEQFLLRADRFAREFGLRTAIRGSGHEYRRLDAVAATERPVILPLDFPKPPDVSTTARAFDVSLEQLMHWDHAPENPGRLAAAGVEVSFTTDGLKDAGTFLKQLQLAVKRGLEPSAALAGLTTNPARLFGVEEDLGTLEPGRLASFVITDGDLFGDKTKVLETWVSGERFEITKPDGLDIRGTWEVVDGDATLVLKLEGTIAKPTGTIVETKLAKVLLEETRLTITFEGEDFGEKRKGVAQLSGVVRFPDEAPPMLLGDLLWPNGQRSSISAKRVEPFEEKEEKEEKTEDDGTPKDGEKKEEPKEPEPASFAVNYPLGAFGVETSPERPTWVVFRNATVWTCGEAGVIENGIVVVKDGRLHSVGTDEPKVPKDAVVVDCKGGHLTPGLIDCHSHFATDGGVNESAQAVTAEVRIGDFVDANDVNIYRQLAGGVTSSNILHGSANPIGGQNQVVKLRWGSLGEEMKFAEAPQGIKFALGENVKQSNWGDDYTSRYPQTRMGVEQLMRDEFQAAKDYRAKQAAWRENRTGLPPRTDLELEAIAEILEGKRWIHCHSYRQDEILALIRTLDDFDVTIGTFQHILEGYKVAEAMAEHGAMGSAFSDWWAYKFEVYDAIPFNGALMHRRGVVVSFNSDDTELARHLNQEAAKAVKYGGIEPTEALKFVTLNPAKQLRIEKWVGSIEKGKHADLVLWSGPPLSNASRVEQTWIDGRRYFDRQQDLKSRTQLDRRRAALIQKVLASGKEPAKPGEEKPMERDLWPRFDEFCTHSRSAARN